PPPRIAGHSFDHLTEKEMEVLKWLGHGKTNLEIALVLKKSPATIKTQVEGILRKLGVENRVALAVIVERAASRLVSTE
ncbi:MAG: helix-turn-helix transcriptional regulator, partial [Burkholderiales bacterium]